MECFVTINNAPLCQIVKHLVLVTGTKTVALYRGEVSILVLVIDSGTAQQPNSDKKKKGRKNWE